MIKYDLTNINKWYNGSRNIVKCYHGTTNAFDLTGGGAPVPPTPTGQTPCYAVTNDISQYQSTDFVDVYDTTADKWYKLNNLNEYEEYGIYGSGRTNTTYYDGKLTIDDEITPAPSRLPQGYTEVEYISSENVSESVLGPYIDTNYKPTQNTRLVIDFQSTSSSRSYQRIFGSGEFDMLGYLVNIEGQISDSGYYYYKFGQTSKWYTTSVRSDLNRHVIDYNNSKQFLVDGTSIATLPNTTFTCSSNLGIFWSINTKYTTNNINFVGRIFSAKVYDNGTLIRDLVPCKRGSDSKYGMYDIVNDVFYTSVNSYNFSGGTEVTPQSTSATCEFVYSGNSWVNLGEVSGSTRLPQGYTEVEYIQNTGTSTSNGAYINSGLKLYDVVGNSFSLSGRVKSEFYSASDDLETILNSENVSSPYYGFVYRYVHTHVIELSCNPSNSVTLSSTANTDGSNDILINCTSTTVTTQVPLGLFASYRGNYTTPYRFAKATIYSLTVVKNGVTVRDFVPAKRDSDSKYGLYDLITDTFYTSPNGNNFSGGTEVTPQYPEYYDEIAEPPTSVTFATMADALAYQCPYVGLRAIIAGDKYVFNSNYEWEEIPSRLPQGYTELTYAQTPNKKTLGGSETFFVPIDLEPTYNYIFSFTPLSWEDSYYSPLVGGVDSDSTNKYSSYGIYKLDNGWGDMSRRFEGSFYNYNIGTRSAGALTGGWRVYTDVKATIKTHLVNYAKGNGVALTVENEGYETVNLTSTTINNSSYTVVDGIYNLQLFTGYGNNAKTPYLKFHELSVKTNNNQYIYQYVPAKRDSDDKVGLFDIINEQFYYPSTFNLTAGDPV